MRRYGEPRRPEIRYTRRPGAYGLIMRGREVLLALNESPGEEVAFPGGGIDPGETPVRALHREVMEETGWRIRIERRLGAYQRYTWMPEYTMWAHKICHIYLCTAGRQVAEPLEPDHTPAWADMEVAAGALSLDAEREVVQSFLL
ncbi:MAG: NUDIX hydrolase [Pseudomonadota bacterium]